MSSSILQAVGFVHLHVHSAYSLREGALGIETLAKLAKADAMPALAITDANNLFGALEFSEKLAKSGIQPIIGAQITVDFADAPSGGSSRLADERFQRAPIVLLAKDERGYLALMRLASSVWLDPKDGDEPHVKFDALSDCEGLIALTGGPAGAIDRALGLDMADFALARLQRLQRLFGDRLYIELQRHGLDSEVAIEPALIDLAYDHSLPLVATNEAYFAAASDFEAQDALLCVAEGALIATPDRRRLSPEHRFKTRAEMRALFEDLPEATDNSVEIALRCAYRPLTRKPILPRFSIPGGEAVDEEQELRRQAREGLERLMARYGLAQGFSEDQYRERLEFELSVIVRMKFPGYFLIVADFIQWAKAKGIPVGPGRGSGAGSLVAYSLTITDLDPIRFGLLFERFLNPERISMPDFDIDFCQDRRDEVIGYVRQRYGADRVAQIITFGSFLARGVLRNVGRVLEMPLGQVDKLAKLVPQNPAKPVTLKQAVADEPRLQEAASADPRVAKMLAIAERLEGLYSNASTHAAGVVIGDRPLVELVPLYRDPKSQMPATQFNMKWVEPAGLVKFDFLGLKTLTTLRIAQRLIARRGVEIELGAIPLDDKKTYEMLGRGETVGVFQVESAGMRKALVEMRADRFEDMIALVALYRPGPMANIPTLLRAQARAGNTGLPPSQGRDGAEGDLRRHHLSGTGDANRAGSVGLFARRGRHAAPRDGQEDQGRDGCAARALRHRRAGTRAEEGQGRRNFRPARQIRRLRLQQEPCGGLRADRLSDRLVQGQPHRRIPRLVDDPGQVEYRQARRIPQRGAAPRSQGQAALGEPIRRRFRRASRCFRRADDRLRPQCDQGCRQVTGDRHRRNARGEREFASLADMARRIDPTAVNKAALECLANAGAFDELEPERAIAFASIGNLLETAYRSAEEGAVWTERLSVP